MMKIDGRPVAIRDGESILEAARRSGAFVPTLCWDERLAAQGSCRLCIVQVDGRLVSSCTQKARDGLEVVTTNAEIDGLRRGLVELTLSLVPEGPCPKCAELGTCELHALADRYGVGRDRPRRFAGALGGAPKEDPNPLLGRDYSRCIDCYRCVRICDEVEGDDAIVAKGRGFATTIATFFDGGLEDSPCELCGQCIHTCPTGALFDKKMRARIEERAIRPEEIQRGDTICNYCGTGCGITIQTARGALLGVTPQMQAPASLGALCVKGQFGLEWLESKDRLTAPLLRTADGSFREATWDEALGVVASGLARIRDAHGPDALAGWASARTTTEANYAFQRLFRGAIGTNNLDNCQRT